MNLSPALTDSELGYQSIQVTSRIVEYDEAHQREKETQEVLTTAGIVHPGPSEKLQLLPEEDRKEEFIEVYVEFRITSGERGQFVRLPDIIRWNNCNWRVVKVIDWGFFGFFHGLAVLIRDVERIK